MVPRSAQRPPPSRSRQRAFRLVLAAGSVAVALGIAEATLRLGFPEETPARALTPEGASWRRLVHRRSELPGLAYELVPNVRERTAHGVVETNAFGMRDRSRTLAPAPGVLRLAAVGDSFTFGFGVPAEATWPARLEAVLAPGEASGATLVEVLNFGVGGYSTRDEAALLRHRVLGFAPAAIVIGYVLNDPEIDPVQPLHAFFADPSAWQRSRVVRALIQAVRNREVAALGGGNYVRALHAHPRKWQSVLDAFDDVRAATEPSGTAVAVAIFPYVPLAGWDRYGYRREHEQVAAAARARGFLVVDLLPTFAGHAPASLRLSTEDHHPTRLGHEVAAREIGRALVSADPTRFRLAASAAP